MNYTQYMEDLSTQKELEQLRARCQVLADWYDKADIECSRLRARVKELEEIVARLVETPYRSNYGYTSYGERVD